MRVLIVEDQSYTAEGGKGVVLELRPHADVQIAGSIAEAKELLDRWGTPDVVMLDLVLPDADGLDALVELRAVLPQAKIAIFSATDRAHVIKEALDLGADAYLRKTLSMHESRRALREFLDRGVHIPPELDDMLARNPPPAVKLSRRQLECVLRMRSGLLVKQIAPSMGLSENTFKTYYKQAYKKLGVRTRTQALLRLKELGYIERGGA